MIVRRVFNSPNWGWQSPFEEMEAMRRRIDQLNRIFSGEEGTGQRGAGVYPLLNVTEDPDNYYVRAELPGLKAEELDISVTGNRLGLSGERKIAAEAEEAKYHRREREGGKFSRVIELPEHVDSDKAAARMANGVLTITLPKAESAKPRQIKVH
jgi:HSP20 family protein